MIEAYAHSLKGKPVETWQPLDVHARNVANLAAAFAGNFNSSDWLRAAGTLHDAGKARQSFQDYLLHANDLPDENYDALEHRHSGPAAVCAEQEFNKLGRILAYLIAGHHAGLPDFIGGIRPHGSLSKRLQADTPAAQEENVQSWLTRNRPSWQSLKLQPPWKFAEPGDAHFWLRMMFSCLVDADCLDTEAFAEPDKACLRTGNQSLARLSERFFEMLNQQQHQAELTPVNQIRAEVRCACEHAATRTPGFFSLTVPTGGGKTLSSTAFAFRHALQHGMQRIIYVIPYTSIIEQTAAVLRSLLGSENVIEHHSSQDTDKESQQARLATENWDAPVVVTTNVQFFESLFACQTGACRKLHNITRSIVILDEAQMLPPELLTPCLDALRQLTANYGCTILLSTATQPAFTDIKPINEIIPDVKCLFRRMKRTRLIFPADRSKPVTWPELAEKLSSLPQVLCIVNTRRDCRELHRLMPDGTYHLSASMCPCHRLKIINEIKQRLKSKDHPVRVISTQLVEAGVDIDFPVVYRAYAGLSSIAQSAGRCNREGKLPGMGQVHVFMPPKHAPPGILRKAENVMTQLLEADIDPENPDSFSRFFHLFYAAVNRDDQKFRAWLETDSCHFQFQFREAAQAFNIIDESHSRTVLVRYDNNEHLLKQLFATGPTRMLLRQLQRYAVNVPGTLCAQLLTDGMVEELPSGLLVQTMPSFYSPVFGLDIFGSGLSPEDLILSNLL